MKKYLVMCLVCCPLVAFGAPSVRSLGSGAVSGTVGATAANRVTPTKAPAVSANRSSSVARVGSLRAKATTTVATPSTTSTSRFPVILPTKVYNTANAPRPTGVSSSSSTVVPSEFDPSGLQQQIDVNRQKIETNEGNITINAENISTNADNISTNAGNISSNTSRIEALEERPEADTVLVSTGPGKPGAFNGREPGANRAWIWVESATE